MAKKFLVPIDLGQLELQNGVIQNLGSDPGSPLEGQLYWNTVSHVLKLYNGTTWIIVARLANSLSDFAAPSADLPMGTHKITGLVDGTAATDAATKGQLDAAVNGLDWKNPVRVATAAALPTNTRSGNVLTASANGALTVDGVTVAVNDRVLVKNEGTGANNGIYLATAIGDASNPFVLTRTTDADSASEILQAAVATEEGTANADTFWVLTTNAPITLNTTSLTFVQFGAGATYTAGTGLSLSGNAFSIENSGVLLPAHGGSGVASPTVHALLVGNGSSAMTVLGIGATGQVLRGQSSADPVWGQLVLTTDVTGVLPIANGGTAGSTAAAAKTSLGFMTRFTVDVGDGAATSYTITHNLGTLDVIVGVYRKSDGVEVECDVTRATTNTVTLAFAVAPASAAYRTVVVG